MSRAGAIVEFFRSSPLETATLVLGLCKDAVSERTQKSQQAKARATAAAGTPKPVAVAADSPAGARKKGAKKAVKKSHKKKLPSTPIAVQGVEPTDVPLPMGQPVGEDIPADDPSAPPPA